MYSRVHTHIYTCEKPACRSTVLVLFIVYSLVCWYSSIVDFPSVVEHPEAGLFGDGFHSVLFCFFFGFLLGVSMSPMSHYVYCSFLRFCFCVSFLFLFCSVSSGSVYFLGQK